MERPLQDLPQYFSRFQFAPVLDLPNECEVYDFTKGYDPNRLRSSPYGIGRYNEKRPGMYVTELFQAPALKLDRTPESRGSSRQEARDIHVGIDLAAPVGSEVRAFFAGRIYLTAINSADGDYGGTVITEHQLGEHKIWALHGHLSHASVSFREVGVDLKAGDVIGWIGERTENGGWNPHLHFQLSWKQPEVCDLPGAVSETDRARALEIYPDPRLVLGPLY